MPSDSARLPRWLPHPLVLHALVLGTLLFAAFLAKGPWDTDYWWHIVTGRLIAEGQFPRTDPFSFTWGGMPWTLHEWLGELLSSAPSMGLDTTERSSSTHLSPASP